MNGVEHRNIASIIRFNGKMRAGAALMLASCLATGARAEPEPMPALASSTAPLLDLEPVVENGRQIYQAAQFTRFAPLTAADMVAQIPGFTITRTSSDRGLGEASQNVLINGQRISGKSDDAQTVLRRTSAKSVVRLEIAEASSFNISGLNGQVLNLITESSGLSGNFAWRPEFRDNIKTRWYNGEFNLSGKLGKGDFTFGVNNNDAFRGGGVGPEITYDAAGNLLYTRDGFAQNSGDRPTITTSYSRASDAGSLLNIKGSLQFYRFRRRLEVDRFGPGQPDIFELTTARENEWNFEGSTDYEFGLGGGRLKLTGYHRYEHSPTRDEFSQNFFDTSPDALSRFNRVANEGETVLRGEYRWNSGKNGWQVSLEGARNFLDAESQFFETDNLGILQEIILPGASSRVEEKRGQLVVSYDRPFAANLTFQAQLGGEYSRLTQSGSSGLTRSFLRPKGLASLAWKPSDRFDASLRLQRKVGQLDFGDFLATVELRDRNDNAGNPDLVPPQSWLAELELNRSLGSAGSLKLKFVGENITDIVDQIPIGASGEAPGNIAGSARRGRAELTASFLLDKLGWKGAKLDIDGAVEHSRLTDPLTFERRPINGSERFYYSVNLRHDIVGTNWAWIATIEDNGVSRFYRLDTVSRSFNSKPQTVFSLENKNILGLKVRATVINLLGQQNHGTQIFYVDRRDGPVDERLFDTTKYGQIYRFTISGTF